MNLRAHRRLPVALASALATVLLGCDGTSDAPPAPGVTATARSAASAPSDAYADDRIAQWMSGCAHTAAFLEDTSDPIPVLVSKLAAGQLDPLRSARTELAAYGEAALPELRRLFEKSYGEMYEAQRVQNVVEVVGAMKTDAGRDLLLRALDHPTPTVRDAAARAITRHPRPEDYDKLLEAMPRSSADAQPDFLLAMIAADRARAERALVEWVVDPAMKGAVRLLAFNVLDSRDETVRDALRPIYPTLEGDTRVHVQTLVAAKPDEAALSELRTWLADASNPSRRQLVAQDLARAGLAGELRGVLANVDPDEGLRKIAAQAIAASPWNDGVRDIQRTVLPDPSREVRGVALVTLCAHGDPAAIDVALQGLVESRQDLEAGLRALRIPMAQDKKLAERVFDTLMQVRDAQVGRGLVDDATILRAIGQVPLEKSARLLMDAAQHAEGTVQGVPAHRWYALAAGNSGPEGMAYIRSLWAGEKDPVRRMDLVMAGTFEKSAATRAFLAEVVESPRSTPPEVLFAADRLAQFGPAAEVAPVLKRVAMRSDDKRVRPALNCLLWTWYGVSK